jgi:hypothetical protein
MVHLRRAYPKAYLPNERPARNAADRLDTGHIQRGGRYESAAFIFVNHGMNNVLAIIGGN